MRYFLSGLLPRDKILTKLPFLHTTANGKTFFSSFFIQLQAAFAPYRNREWTVLWIGQVAANNCTFRKTRSSPIRCWEWTQGKLAEKFIFMWLSCFGFVLQSIGQLKWVAQHAIESPHVWLHVNEREHTIVKEFIVKPLTTNCFGSGIRSQGFARAVNAVWKRREGLFKTKNKKTDTT